MNKSNKDNLSSLVSLCKRRGFVYPTSEIYGGLTSSYDYGPLGAELLRKIRDTWWQELIINRDDMVGLDSQIILNPQTWVASGHVNSLTDPLVEDKVNHKRYRADHLIEDWLEKHPEEKIIVEDLNTDQMADFIRHHNILSPDGNQVTDPKDFSLLFETSIGSVAGDKAKVYLRGETAQGIFTNFKQILDSTRVDFPFGIGQIGKSFRNEITTGQFIFRTLEFEQAEIEYFFDPNQTDWHKLFKDWQDTMWHYVTQTLGIQETNLRWRQHTAAERSHYSQDTWDLDYQYPFGWKELWGIAYRTDYDLVQHIKHSGKKLHYTNPQTGKKLVPHVIEPAVGINRIFLMILADAYTEDDGRVFLKLKPSLAPFTAAVFPLLANKPELIDKAKHVRDQLKPEFSTVWDQRGNIGKRYATQDEIGTPFCVTIDFDSLDDDTVTIRHRDTAKQERVSTEKLPSFIKDQLHKHLF